MPTQTNGPLNNKNNTKNLSGDRPCRISSLVNQNNPTIVQVIITAANIVIKNIFIVLIYKIV